MRQGRSTRLERRLVWILGSPRSGSTWLTGLLATLTGGVAIAEPLIGLHLGALASDALDAPSRLFDPSELRLVDNRADDRHYFFGDEFRSAWLPALRQLILTRFAAQLATIADDGKGYILVKEPNGSLAADVLLEATPTSRLLFLLRDGRDVVDSQLDAAKPGAWLAVYGGGEEMSPERRMAYLEERAYRWVANTVATTAAYDALPEPQRLLLRYEDLLSDPRAHLEQTLTWLGVTVPETIESEITERRFDSQPNTGSGRFARAAQPGLWRENLTADEQKILSEIMGETLARFGYET